MAQIQYQHSHCFPSPPPPLSSPSSSSSSTKTTTTTTTPGNNNRCCNVMQPPKQKQQNDEIKRNQLLPSLGNRMSILHNNNNINASSSIIGYTRVPFFTFSPASSIVPVKQQQINRTGGALTCLGHYSSKQASQENNNNNKLCQRIFKREQSHGMMELIQEHKNKNNNNNKNKKIKYKKSPSTLRHQDDSCGIALSIDISGQRNQIPMNNNKSNVNISMLIDSISKMADLYAVQFENILYLLEQLQLCNQQFRALVKNNKTIWIFFPRTIFPVDEEPTMDHAYHWLIQVLAINVDDHTNWEIIDTTHRSIDGDDGKKKAMDKSGDIDTGDVGDGDGDDDDDDDDDDGFDGANYFKDIHMFLDHVDQMMESNHLFGSSATNTATMNKNTPSRI